MAWNNQPGGSGSGNNGGRGPWGQPGPQQGGNNGSGNGGRGPADLEELLKSGRDRFRRGGRGGGSAGSPPGDFKMPPTPILFLGGLILVGLYLASGIYSIAPGARGVETTFGAYSGITGPGLQWHAPWPIQDVTKVDVVNDRNISIQRSQSDRISMVTSDLNIVDVEMTVNYRVAADGALASGELPNAAKFIFNIEGHDNLVRATAEAALRQVVGANDFEPIISRDRSLVGEQTQEILQDVLDSYDSGIEIIRVNFGGAYPPREVEPAQDDLIDARSEAESSVNKANQYRNSTVPEARGRARQVELEAEAYAQRVVREANGQARRFKDIYAEYLLAPEVTRRRMYLENMENVLGKMDKVVIDDAIGGSAVPYMNLNELTRKAGSTRTGGQ